MSVAWIRGISTDASWATVAVLIPVGATLLLPTQAVDLAYQLRAGELMIQMGRVLRTDPFTYTVYGQPWLDQQWGAQVLFALGYRAGGWFALDILRGACVGASAWFVSRSCLAKGVRARTATLLTICGWLVASPALAQLRPQLVGTVMFCVCMWLLAIRRDHPLRVWLVPVVVVIWANVHGSFPLAFLLLGLAVITDLSWDRASARRLIWVSLSSMVATAVTPFGPSVWGYVLDLATHPVVAERINEWGPLSTRSATGLLFLISLGVVALVLVTKRRSVSVEAVIAFLVFGVMSLFAVRAVVWWALTMPVVLAGVLAADRSSEVPDDTRSPVGVVLLGTLGAFVVLALAGNRGTDPRSGGPAMMSFAPEHLVASMRETVPPGSNVFASQLHASWAEFSAPGFRYAVDSRVELFPETIWDAYFRISDADDGWEAILEEDGVAALLLDPHQAAGLLAILEANPRWRPLIENDDGAVYVRT